MATLGLKLFYLRTRHKQLSQQEVADELGVRQGTLSHVERGVSLPAYPLLLALCRFYDVTPTYLMDESRGLEPRPTERWSMRDGLVTVGMWVEVDSEDVVTAPDHKLLCPMRPAARFFDDEAVRIRTACKSAAKADAELAELDRRRDDAEARWQRELAAEQNLHPRQRKGVRPNV